MKKQFLSTLAIVALSLAPLTSFSQVGAGNGLLDTGGGERTDLSVGGGWEPVDFGGVGVPTDPVRFDLIEPACLTVTDAFLSGDRFEVFDFTSSLGLTSMPLSTGDAIGADPDGALADPRWSSGMFNLALGIHSITLVPVLSPFGSGGAFLRLDPGVWQQNPIPETSTYLSGIGLALGIGAVIWRRRKA